MEPSMEPAAEPEPTPEPMGPPELVISPESIDFGLSGLNQSTVRTLDLRNNGQGRLTVERVALEEMSQGFSVMGPQGPVTLEAGEEASYDIEFRPTVSNGLLSQYGNRVSIESNDPEQSQVLVPLSGVALPVSGVTVVDLRVVVTWDTRGDLDLHLARSSNGEFPPFGRRQDFQFDDCYWDNLDPDWGLPGLGEDNPEHMGDDQDGDGPEEIKIFVLETTRNYRIGVRYSGARGGGDATARVAIFRGSEMVGQYERTLDDVGSIWVPAVVLGDGTIMEVDDVLP